MPYKQVGTQVLASKPSTAFSTRSAASATSAATSRSGGSRLLFGEIDTNSERSSESYASVCSFVQSDSSTFLKFWLEDKCRETFLSHVDTPDLTNLRLACHDFSVRAAPALFSDMSITFRSSTFTKPARLAALERIGFYVKRFTFRMPHSTETFLPPLVDPETGAELSFTYTPQLQASTARQPKYGDLGTTEILTRQWPTLFHAATNVPAFIKAFSSFINLSHLTVSCPGYDSTERYRRNTVDFALISLRIAVERSNLNALESLTLSPMHPGGLLHLSPQLGQGSTPRSASRWARIKHLTIYANALPTSAPQEGPDQFKLLQSYLRTFQPALTTLTFGWLGQQQALPFHCPLPSHPPQSTPPTTTASRPLHPRPQPPTHFPCLRALTLSNTTTTSPTLRAFATTHKTTLRELDFHDVHLSSGTWEEALAPLTSQSARRPRGTNRDSAPRREVLSAEIPIMLSPGLPRGGGAQAGTGRGDACGPGEGGEVKGVMFSKWLTAAGGRTRTSSGRGRRVREGWAGCEGSLRKVLRGDVFGFW